MREKLSDNRSGDVDTVQYARILRRPLSLLQRRIVVAECVIAPILALSTFDIIFRIPGYRYFLGDASATVDIMGGVAASVLIPLSVFGAMYGRTLLRYLSLVFMSIAIVWLLRACQLAHMF